MYRTGDCKRRRGVIKDTIRPFETIKNEIKEAWVDNDIEFLLPKRTAYTSNPFVIRLPVTENKDLSIAFSLSSLLKLAHFISIRLYLLSLVIYLQNKM